MEGFKKRNFKTVEGFKKRNWKSIEGFKKHSRNRVEDFQNSWKVAQDFKKRRWNPTAWRKNPQPSVRVKIWHIRRRQYLAREKRRQRFFVVCTI